MLLTYNKTGKATIVVLNDLIKINNDRMGCYQQAIDQMKNLDIDLKDLFEEIISEGLKFKQELIDAIKRKEGNPKDIATISGMIHRAWVDLKVTFTGNTRYAIINFCEYNEQVAQHAYKAALDVIGSKDKETYIMIKKQQEGLTASQAMIKKCHGARSYFNPQLVYFS